MPWTFVGALLTAFVFAVALYHSLPPDDLAREDGAGPLLPFAMLVFAGGSAVGALPFTLVLLRRAQLVRATVVVYGSVLAWVVAVTPFAGFLGWLGAYPVLVGALVLCRAWSWVTPRADPAPPSPDGASPETA